MMMMMCESMYSIKKNTEALVVASEENGLEVNADKTKYVVVSLHINIIAEGFNRLYLFLKFFL